MPPMLFYVYLGISVWLRCQVLTYDNMLYMMYRVDRRSFKFCLISGDERNIHCLAMKKVKLQRWNSLDYP